MKLTHIARQAQGANGLALLIEGERVYLDTTGHYDDGSVAVRLIDGTGAPYATLSTRIVEDPAFHSAVSDGYAFWARTYALDLEAIVPELRECGYFVDSGIRIAAGHGYAEAWAFMPWIDKQVMCKALGIDWYAVDSAIPQPWLDEQADLLAAHGRPRSDAYEMLRTGLVWGRSGPIGLTYEADAFLAGSR